LRDFYRWADFLIYDGMGNEALLRFIFAGLENWRKLGRRFDSFIGAIAFLGGAGAIEGSDDE
jgi:hypothetical protein